MRAIVHAAPGGPERMQMAVAGLALRGHLVIGHGSAWGEGQERRGARADLVLGDARSPLRTAWVGGKAGAHAMVLALEPERVRRWSALDRWACHSVFTAGMVEPAERDAMRAIPTEIELERIGLWSDEPPPSSPDPAHPDVEWLERACERALARHRGRAPRPAVFLDRDGTIVVERGYLSDPSEIELLPGAARALRELKAAGYPLVVVSNQSGVGRGLFPASRVHEAMARLRGLLREHGVELDGIYFCPHRPDEGCACRKPGTALLERAADDLRLDLKRSVMVGDKRLDPETGRRAGGLGLLVRTGYGRDEEQRSGEEGAEPRPDAAFDDLAAAARWILERGPGEG
ncbi:MAG TPA: HAD family hydrolase [Candidatus Eisenbacteria bacterium]|jgi:histidinol-phosphate phosphatase family protein